jgi:hypothetical protein
MGNTDVFIRSDILMILLKVRDTPGVCDVLEQRHAGVFPGHR